MRRGDGSNVDELTEQFNRILKEKNDIIDHLQQQAVEREIVKRAQPQPQQYQGPVRREAIDALHNSYLLSSERKRCE